MAYSLLRDMGATIALYQTDAIWAHELPADVTLVSAPMWALMRGASGQATEKEMLALFSGYLGKQIVPSAGVPDTIIGGGAEVSRFIIVDAFDRFEFRFFHADTSSAMALGSVVMAIVSANLWGIVKGVIRQPDDAAALAWIGSQIGKNVVDVRDKGVYART